MVSRKYKAIFVHVPKAAGQSIEHFFLKRHGLSWKKREPLLLKRNPNPERGPSRLAHLTAEEYIKHNYVSEDEFNKFYKFSFVRNPWARLVSEYKYGGYDKQYAFKEFVMKGFPEKDLYTNAYRHIMPQYEYIYDGEGKKLVDFVGKLENLQNDFDVVCSSLGLADSALLHVNSSNRRNSILGRLMARLIDRTPKPKIHYSEYYNAKLADHVANIYSKDLEAFNYEFTD